MKRISIFLIITLIVSVICMPVTYGERFIGQAAFNHIVYRNIPTRALEADTSITIIPKVYGIDWKQSKLESLNITIIYGTGEQEVRRVYSFQYDESTIKIGDIRPFKAQLQYDKNNKPIYDYKYCIAAEFSSGMPDFNSGMCKASSPILSIGPLDLNLLCVRMQASSTIDWEQISSISIDIECEGVKAPLIELDKSNTKREIAYPIGHKPNYKQAYNYKYTISYNMKDGCYKTIGYTSQVELIIPSFSNEKLVYTFMMDEDPAIKNIFLTLEYEDSNNKYRKQISSIDINNCKDKQYQWEIPVIDSRSGDVFFSGSIVYNDGSPIKQILRTKATSNYVLVYKGVPKIELDIISALIDWNKYSMAIITLEYKDEVNHLYYRTSKKLVKNSGEQKWVINIADMSKTEYIWSGQFITTDRKVYKVESSTINSDYLLIIPPQI